MAKKQSSKKPSKKTAKAPKPDAAVPATWPESKPRKVRARDSRLPAAGTTLTRVYKGRELKVTVLEDGFRFEGETYSSLSALAAKATGQASINGFLWMNLTKRPATPKPESATQTEKAAETVKARAPRTVAKVRRAGRDPQPVATTESASATPPAEVAPTA